MNGNDDRATGSPDDPGGHAAEAGQPGHGPVAPAAPGAGASAGTDRYPSPSPFASPGSTGPADPYAGAAPGPTGPYAGDGPYAGAGSYPGAGAGPTGPYAGGGPYAGAGSYTPPGAGASSPYGPPPGAYGGSGPYGGAGAYGGSGPYGGAGAYGGSGPYGPAGSGPAPGAYGAPPGYGPYTPYGYGGYGGYGPPPKKTNGLAIASLIVSISSFLFCQFLLVGLLGLILGIVARRQINRNDEGGAGLALAGIIVGGISVGLSVLLIGGLFTLGALTPSVGSSSGGRRPGGGGFATTTTERVRNGGTTVPRPGTSVEPSGDIREAACPTVLSAFDDLMSPELLDASDLSQAAITLHAELPASVGDDIDTVLADTIPRSGRENTGVRSAETIAALGRLDAIIANGCPS